MDLSEKQELLALLDAGEEEFVRALLEVSQELESRRPGEGKWSIAECVEHIALAEEHMLEGVLRATRSSDFDELVRWAATASAAEVAALAPHVLSVAAQGDQLAQGITDYAARELSQLAICLLTQMSLNPPVPVAK